MVGLSVGSCYFLALGNGICISDMASDSIFVVAGFSAQLLKDMKIRLPASKNPVITTKIQKTLSLLFFAAIWDNPCIEEDSK